MPHGIECQCCREMYSVHGQDEISCTSSHKQFSVVCLNKDVLYTVLVMISVNPCDFLIQTSILIRIIKSLIHDR